MSSIKKRKLRELTDYPPDSDWIDKIKIPSFSEQDIIKSLEEESAYDTLGSFSIDVEKFGTIPAYKIEFYYLQKKFTYKDMPLEEYAKGYFEGLKTEFISYIDTPENRKEIIINTIRHKQGIPIRFKVDDEYEYEWLEEKDFFEYGLFIGKQKKAWDIVLKNRLFFNDFLNEYYPRFANNQLVLKYKPDPDENNSLTVPGITIMHFYWGIVDKTKKLSNTNVESLCKNYINGSTGKPYSTKYIMNINRQFNSKEAIMSAPSDNKRSIEEHISRFKKFLPILKKESPDAYRLAYADLNKLKNKYNSYLL